MPEENERSDDFKKSATELVRSRMKWLERVESFARQFETAKHLIRTEKDNTTNIFASLDAIQASINDILVYEGEASYQAGLRAHVIDLLLKRHQDPISRERYENAMEKKILEAGSGVT